MKIFQKIVFAFIFVLSSCSSSDNNTNSTKTPTDQIDQASISVFTEKLPDSVAKNATSITSVIDSSDIEQGPAVINIPHIDGLPTAIVNKDDDILVISSFSRNSELTFDAESTATSLALLIVDTDDYNLTQQEYINRLYTSQTFSNLINEIQSSIDNGAPLLTNQNIIDSLVAVIDEVTIPLPTTSNKTITARFLKDPFGYFSTDMLPFDIIEKRLPKSLFIEGSSSSGIEISNTTPVVWVVNENKIEASTRGSIEHDNSSIILSIEIDKSASLIHLASQITKTILSNLRIKDECSRKLAQHASANLISSKIRSDSFFDDVGSFFYLTSTLKILKECTGYSNSGYLKLIVKTILSLSKLHNGYSIMNTLYYVNKLYDTPKKEVGVCISDSGVIMNCAERFEFDPAEFVIIAGDVVPMPSIVAFDSATPGQGNKTLLPGGLELSSDLLAFVSPTEIAALAVGTVGLKIREPITEVETPVYFDIVEPVMNPSTLDLYVGDTGAIKIEDEFGRYTLRGDSEKIFDLDVISDNENVVSVYPLPWGIGYKANNPGEAVIRLTNIKTGHIIDAHVIVDIGVIPYWVGRYDITGGEVLSNIATNGPKSACQATIQVYAWNDNQPGDIYAIDPPLKGLGYTAEDAKIEFHANSSQINFCLPGYWSDIDNDFSIIVPASVNGANGSFTFISDVITSNSLRGRITGMVEFNGTGAIDGTYACVGEWYATKRFLSIEDYINFNTQYIWRKCEEPYRIQ